MAYVSITRLSIRSWRFMPAFGLHMWRSLAQVKRAQGFRAGSLLADRNRAFWTMTLWDDAASMRRYMTGGAHMRAMPKLLHWCDEASIAHWDGDALPEWSEADRRMRREGRPSKVIHPGPHHADQSYAPPRAANPLPVAPQR